MGNDQHYILAVFQRHGPMSYVGLERCIEQYYDVLCKGLDVYNAIDCCVSEGFLNCIYSNSSHSTFQITLEGQKVVADFAQSIDVRTSYKAFVQLLMLCPQHSRHLIDCRLKLLQRYADYSNGPDPVNAYLQDELQRLVDVELRYLSLLEEVLKGGRSD